MKRALVAISVLAAIVLTGCYARPTMPENISATTADLRTDSHSIVGSAGDHGLWYWRYVLIHPANPAALVPLPTVGTWQRTPAVLYDVSRNIGLDTTRIVTQLQPGSYYYDQLCATNLNPNGGWSGEKCIDGKGQVITPGISDKVAPIQTGTGGGQTVDKSTGDDNGTPADMFRTQPWISCKDDFGQRAPGPGNIDLNGDGYCEPPGKTNLGDSFYIGFNDPNTSTDERTFCYIHDHGEPGWLPGWTTCQQNYTPPEDLVGVDSPDPQEDLNYAYHLVKTQGFGAGACATAVASWTEHNRLGGRLWTVKQTQKICLTGGGGFDPCPGGGDCGVHVSYDFSTAAAIGGWKADCGANGCFGGYKILHRNFSGKVDASRTKRLLSMTLCTLRVGCIQTVKFPLIHIWNSAPNLITSTSNHGVD